jgi:hypothetical protein
VGWFRKCIVPLVQKKASVIILFDALFPRRTEDRDSTSAGRRAVLLHVLCLMQWQVRFAEMGETMSKMRLAKGWPPTFTFVVVGKNKNRDMTVSWSQGGYVINSQDRRLL